MRALRAIGRLLLTGVFLTALAGGCASTAPASKHDSADDDERYALWAARFGGTVDGVPLQRARLACDAVAARTVRGDVSVRVLRTARPVAYSFPDGTVFVSAGLVDLLDDAELTAVIAHEVGHLLADRRVAPLAALAGTGGATDVETRADAIACQLLTRAGRSPGAMAGALRRVADSPLTGSRDRAALLRRVTLLEGAPNPASVHSPK